jgi:hypothetical protein
VYQATVLDNPWIPGEIKAGNTPRQVEFLCFEGREGFFGGAAGPGKSVGLLEAALQYVEEPGYHALILRRTFKQLSMADSILGKAKDWLWGKVKYVGSEHKFTFPNGNTLQFGHMDHEDAVRDYIGGIWAFIGVDEATQFTGHMLALPAPVNVGRPTTASRCGGVPGRTRAGSAMRRSRRGTSRTRRVGRSITRNGSSFPPGSKTTRTLTARPTSSSSASPVSIPSPGSNARR